MAFSRPPQTPPEDGLPPEQVRFTELRVEPWPDGRKVRVHVSFTPFLQRPNVHMVILNAAGGEAASIDIIENMEEQIAFTMHLRGGETAGPYQLLAAIDYENVGTVAQGQVTFELPEAPG